MVEDIILKIQKLLALSKSSNENEAQNAMLKAQQLLIKHKLSLKDVELYSSENIKVDSFNTEQRFRGQSWKSNLAQVIADNFSCYMYLQTSCNYRSKVRSICFYGKGDDVVICNIMFSYASKCINTEGDKLVKRMKQDRRRKYFKGIKDDYALGFIAGLKERFNEQIRNNSEWGLVIQKDQIVIDKYREFSKDFGTVNVSKKFYKHSNAFKLGQEDGRKFDISNKIQNEEEPLISNF